MTSSYVVVGIRRATAKFKFKNNTRSKLIQLIAIETVVFEVGPIFPNEQIEKFSALWQHLLVLKFSELFFFTIRRFKCLYCPVSTHEWFIYCCLSDVFTKKLIIRKRFHFFISPRCTRIFSIWFCKELTIRKD